MLSYYNPFLRIDSAAISKLLEAGTPFVIIQRFAWPGVPSKKGFLFTAYQYEHEAQLHAHDLAPNEGKAFNLNEEADFNKLIELTQPGSGLSVFFNGTIDRDNEMKLKRAFKNHVLSYIDYARIPKHKQCAVRIFVEYGRVKAEITSGSHSHTALFYQMIS